MTKVTRDQFGVKGHSIRHEPTGATFFTEPGSNMIKEIEWGTAGTTLPNGDIYDRDEIQNMVGVIGVTPNSN